jgi:hypothetical protein
MCGRSAADHSFRAFLAGLLTCTTAFASAATPDAAQEARTFLLRYVGLTAASDIAALDIYRDDARVRVATAVGGRETQTRFIGGKEWKEQIRAGWFDGTTRLEASTFTGATAAVDGNRLLIRAQRYSRTRCYWDNSYAVAIEPDRVGRFQTVEERITFERNAVCTDAKAEVAQQDQSAAAAAVANPSTFAAVAARVGTPPNIVPSGRGIPRLPQRYQHP